jgi:glycosyltransferase involved in cell wall biosynthesis
MRMLISYLYCNKGGVTSVIKQRMPGILKNGWIVDAAFVKDHGGKLDLINSGVNEVFLFDFHFKNSVQKLLKEGNYDLHVIFDAPELLNFETQKKTKVIFEIHTPILTTIKKYKSDKLNNCDAILVPSKWSKETICDLVPGVYPDKIKVIPNIVDEKIFNIKGHSYSISNTMIWVGKLAEYKNWKEAMKIGGLFIQNHPSWQFLAVTGGLINKEDTSSMLQEFISLDNISKFRWLHNLNHEDMGKLYRGAAKTGGFLLSTSKAESFCLVVHEAMRCGLPVVSSNIGPLPEIVEDGVSGFLYELGDIKTAVNNSNLYLNKELRDKIISEGFNKLSSFDQSAIEEEYMKAINEVLENI